PGRGRAAPQPARPRATPRAVRCSAALAAARLAGRWLSTNPDYQVRAHTFLRVAAGLARPEAADALR
ncbi:hypothetical protein, partial [Falsiroseomonas oryzae]|uniref:hypothetical protein n=1 Tax=Falsiroseomonas oryzae TaxID=2766473 RepID=UPI0022EACEE7